MRSRDSWGVGEFNDLKKYASWADKVGIRLIQVLPVNDTTAHKNWHDSYPYAAISVFALHPMYLHLPALAGSKYKSLVKKYEVHRQELNALKDVDYEAVNSLKWQLIKTLYPLLKKATFSSEQYRLFLSENEEWLRPYACFCFLRDHYNTCDFSQWGEASVYSENVIASVIEQHEDAVALHYFVQFHLSLQLKEAVQFAHQHKVVLKGDIPIGVYRNSVEAWQKPELFQMNMQAGAPPDEFATKGQNWGFPTYNWEEMKRNHFHWWRKRLGAMSAYFDVIRIDHILGFFRIWSIPLESVQGILGHFEPSVPVHLRELYGINVSTERLLNPHITDDVLFEYFGMESVHVKDQFLTKDENGSMHFKEAYTNQRSLDAYFETLSKTDHNLWLKEKLFDLIANVVLIASKEQDTFYFRFNMYETPSYKSLDEGTKSILNGLYQDYYFHRQEDLWKREALEKLPAIMEATNMLVCGEDLGLVPYCVKDVMEQLQLLSLEVQRMPKKAGVEFENPVNAPYLSVVTPSTHDTSSIRGWWKNISLENRRKFIYEQLHLNAVIEQDAQGWLVEAIINQHLNSGAMWSIFLLQDLLAIDEDLRIEDPEMEQINRPDHPDHYWRYRSNVPIEELLNNKDFNLKIKSMIIESGR